MIPVWMIPLTMLIVIPVFTATGQHTLTDKATADSLLHELHQSPEQDNSATYNLLAGYYFPFDSDSALLLTKRAIKAARHNNNEQELGYAYKNMGNYHLHANRPDSAFFYYSKAEAVFSGINFPEGLLSIYNNIGVIHKNLGQHELALKYFQKVHQIAAAKTVDPAVKVSLYSNLAGIYYLQGNAELGMQYLDSALKLTKDIPRDCAKGLIYNNMGVFFSKIERYDKALTLLQQAEEIFEPEHHQKMTYLTYKNLGDVYQKIYNYDRAEKYYRQTLNHYLEHNDSSGIANTLLPLAELYIMRRDYGNARKYLGRALEIYDQYGDKQGKANTVLALAEAHIKEGNPGKALDYLESHQQFITSSSDPAVLEAYYDLLRRVYYATGNYKQGYEALQSYQSYKDSVDALKQQANMHVLKQELEMSELDIQQDFNRQKEQIARSNERSFMIFYLVTALLILAAFFILYRYIREKRHAAEKTEKYRRMEQALEKSRQEKKEIDRQIEEQVREKTAQLQKEVDAYKKKDYQLKKTLKEVEDANYLKNAFLSNMSHEIRTPLNGIIGFASLLETELSLLENQELYGYASGIQQSGERLLHLLNNIIDISRIEANDLQVTLQESNINQLIEKSAEIYKYQADEKNLSFNIKLEDTPMVYVDPDSVTKMLSDILDNAVKYTEKGFINVTNGYEKRKQEVFVKIRDTGIGIDDNYLPRVFEAFRQESLGYSRAFQGAGLGLPLAKRLLDLMNGRIDIESKKDEGTTVIVYLPTKETFKHVQDSLKKTGKEQQSTTRAVKDVRVFLVEDDRMNRLVINKMLSDWNVDSGEDGDITIEKIEKAYKEGIIYDIMLFDINLPNPWDGVKLMHYIKKKFPKYQEIPFIAQTAYAMRGDRERLLEEGFDDYMSKPLSQQRLLTTLYKFLKKGKGEGE